MDIHTFSSEADVKSLPAHHPVHSSHSKGLPSGSSLSKKQSSGISEEDTEALCDPASAYSLPCSLPLCSGHTKPFVVL